MVITMSNKEQFRKAMDILFEAHSSNIAPASHLGNLSKKISQMAKKNDVDLTDDPVLCELMGRLETKGQIDNELIPAIAEIFCYLYDRKEKVNNLN